MNLSAFDFLILVLATWYLAYVVTNPALAGPFGALAWFRTHVALGGLTACIKCFAPWTAALLWLVWQTPAQPLVWLLAAAGAALMLAAFSGVQHS